MATTETTVADIVRDDIHTARVFERYGIDYCCGGDVPLDEACQQVGADVEEVRSALDSLEEANKDQVEFSTCSLGELADSIVAQHHTWLRTELPRLGGLMERVVEAHAENHPELNELQLVFIALDSELHAHMLKEEQVLFPIVKQLEQAAAEGATNVEFHCGSVNNPIRMMEYEHENAGLALHKLRELTHGFQPPEDACPTYQALLSGLQELEHDLHLHIHKENNILFPRAAELERQVNG